MVKPSTEQYDKATDAFAANLRVVLRGRQMNRAELGESMEKAVRSVSQKTVYNVADQKHPPKLETLVAIAEKLKIPLWVMFIPDLPPELLEPSELARFTDMIGNYFETLPDHRQHIESTAVTWAANRKLQDTGTRLPALKNSG